MADRSAADAVRRAARGLGQTLITVGLVLGLFCVYELQVTGLYTERAAGGAGRASCDRTWELPAPAPAGQPGGGARSRRADRTRR